MVLVTEKQGMLLKRIGELCKLAHAQTCIIPSNSFFVTHSCFKLSLRRLPPQFQYLLYYNSKTQYNYAYYSNDCYELPHPFKVCAVWYSGQSQCSHEHPAGGSNKIQQSAAHLERSNYNISGNTCKIGNRCHDRHR